MQTNTIHRTHKLKKKKLIGRGGKRGNQSGRGTKGQSARAGGKLRPQMRDIIKKLPKLRGHGVNRADSVIYKDPKKYVAINLGQLNIFEDGDTVNPKSLQAKGLIKLRNGKVPQVKILGNGELTKKVKIEDCQVSKTVEAKMKA